MPELTERPRVDRVPADTHDDVQHTACSYCYEAGRVPRRADGRRLARCGVWFRPRGESVPTGEAIRRHPNICPLCVAAAADHRCPAEDEPAR